MEFTGERFIPLERLLNDEIAFEHLHRYHAASFLAKNKIVVDIACGEGYGSAILAATAEKVTGIDISEEVIAHAAKTYGSVQNLQFTVGAADAIPIADRSIDLVVAFETIEHLDETTQEGFLKEIKRILKTNGILVISTPDKSNYSDRHGHINEFHVKEFTGDEFRGFLQQHFKSVQSYEQGYEIVSAISEPDPARVKDLRIVDWDRKTKPFSRQYLIAVCSDEAPGNASISSVVLQVNKEYQEQVDRIVEMEAHIVELGQWGHRLDDEIRQKDELIRKWQTEINEQSAALVHLTSLKDHLSEEKQRMVERELFARIELQQKLDHLIQIHENNREKDALIASLEESLRQKQSKLNSSEEQLKILESELAALVSSVKLQVGNLNELDAVNQSNAKLSSDVKFLTVEKEKLEALLRDSNSLVDEESRRNLLLSRQLESVNAQLRDIYASDGWKWLKRYYGFKGRLLPENSARYRFLRNTLNFLRGRKVASPPAANTGASPAGTSAAAGSHPVKMPVRRSEYLPIEFPLFEHPAVSIVMPAYNGFELTYACLESIRQHTLGVSYEVIIGDDASTDETREIEKYIKNIVVVHNEKNLEFLHNCNHAASFAKGDYILFLNNDTEVTNGWLSSMVELFERDPLIGMVGSKLVYPDGRLQEAGSIIWNDASGWNFGYKQNPDASEYNYVKEADYISGASIVIRTPLWKEIGGFDVRYTPAYCEDSDLAFEVRKHGYKVVYQPLSVVIHYEGFTHGTDETEGIKGKSIKEYQRLNNQKFREKWNETLLKEHFPNGENVFLARDRSRSKKAILVIDHYVPHYDKDAGSRTVFQYLKLFVALGMNVKFIGDNYFRHEPYTTVLQQLGIEVLYGPQYAANWQDWIKSNGGYFDFILMNRPHISIKYIDFLKANTKAKLMYYGHDLHFVRLQKQYEVERKQELLDEAGKWKDVELSMFDKVDVALAPSTEERDLIESFNVRSKVFAIKPYIFDTAPDAIDDFSRRTDILFIGGYTHLPNVDAVLWFAREVWPKVQPRIPGAKFLIAGSNSPESVNALASDDIQVLGMISDAELQRLYGRIRMVVIPLRYGAGVKGKTVEALFHGIPVVTTEFGSEGLPGQLPFTVADIDPQDFATEVVRQYTASNAELTKLSQQETEYIKQHFSVSVVRSEMEAIFEELSGAAAPVLKRHSIH